MFASSIMTPISKSYEYIDFESSKVKSFQLRANNRSSQSSNPPTIVASRWTIFKHGEHSNQRTCSCAYGELPAFYNVIRKEKSMKSSMNPPSKKERKNPNLYSTSSPKPNKTKNTRMIMDDRAFIYVPSQKIPDTINNNQSNLQRYS